MKILGHTESGDLIIQVSKEEWDNLGKGVKPREMTFYQTETHRFLNKMPLPGLPWLRYLSDAFDRGEIDGSLESVKAYLVGDNARAHIRKRGLVRLKEVLGIE